MDPLVVSLSPAAPAVHPGGRLVSYSQASPGVTVTGFLRHARGRERLYWQDGQDPVTFAGFGVAAELFAWGSNRFQDIRRQAAALFHDAVLLDGGRPVAGDGAPAAPRLMGGFSFRDDFAPDNTWSIFHPAHFILPHYQLAQVAGQQWLTINTILPREESPRANLPQLQEAWQARYALLQEASQAPSAPEPAPPRVVDLRYPMPYTQWATLIKDALAQMRAGDLHKVVLSRVCELRFDRAIDVDGALAYLQTHYGGCYRFLFEPRPAHAFYGATPELLVQVTGQRLETMGLAGSIGRGDTAAADEALAQELLHHPKDRHEHRLVVEAIQRRLRLVTTSLHVPEPRILRLSNIQHIHTPIIGALKEASGVLPLVERLHPTPALGGAPRRPALDFIRRAEPVPRGWYAAPVGWIDHRLDGTFAVAIRSAVTQADRVWLYAGSGIVPESEAEKEWAETTLKFRPMLEALGTGEEKWNDE